MCFNIASTIKKNDMDLIYLIILTPITIAVMYGAHCIKLNSKRFNEMPEAKPYQFERDEQTQDHFLDIRRRCPVQKRIH